MIVISGLRNALECVGDLAEGYVLVANCMALEAPPH